MDRVGLANVPAAQTRSKGLVPTFHLVVLHLFLVQFVLVCANLWLPIFGQGNALWPRAVLLGLATATTCTSLARRLPPQNVLSATAIIVLSAAVMHGLASLGGKGAGPYLTHVASEPNLIRSVPWITLVVWVLVLLNSRGIARSILRPFRRRATYGLWILGATTVLAVVDFNLWTSTVAFATSPLWTKGPHSWPSASLVSFVVEAIMALISSIAITPALINKKPGLDPADFHPLLVWTLLTLLAFLS